MEKILIFFTKSIFPKIIKTLHNLLTNTLHNKSKLW